MFRLSKNIIQYTFKRQQRYYSTVNNVGSGNNKYDVVIVGGGLVGSTMACTLGSNESTSHLKVALIEASPHQPLYPLSEIPDIRTISFNNNSIQLFKQIGIWEDLESTKRIQSFNTVKVWDSSGFPGIDFDDSDSMGYIIENRIVTSSLLDKIKSNYKNIDIKQSMVKGIGREDDNGLPENYVQLSNDEKVFGKLIIGADGGNSVIKKELKIPSMGRNYNQKAVVCTIKLGDSVTPCTTLFQRFLPTGPIALLPLANNYANIIWSTNNLHANYLLSLKDEEFKDVLEQSFLKGLNTDQIGLLNHLFNLNPSGLSGQEIYMPPIEKVVSKRASFPLRLDHTQQYSSNENPGIVLIGDASHIVHPLAGQGVNLGLQDVQSLSAIIKDSVQSGHSISDPMMLKQYEQQRKAENLKMMASIDTLFNMFTNNSLPIVVLRNLGMSILNHIPLLKSLIIGVSKGVTPSTTPK
ncbi:monooxygenase [Tieghemostelium lacteum]|uniref:Ubiquinone biosynthesis monooxygenase COQ6, mitochondrial n=1 Tax=Tieghemostelium lacteum TaxID=361077 RepID=A0A151ZF74_TIELA|nr:monooxygenase [Tieghemostelium lacteum]|eukprot:KYQ92524.1 monooxygenase [Tieghemostelium lacteum]